LLEPLLLPLTGVIGVVLAAQVDDAVNDDAMDDEATVIVAATDVEVELDVVLAVVVKVVQVIMEHEHVLPDLTQTPALIALQVYLQATCQCSH